MIPLKKNHNYFFVNNFIQKTLHEIALARNYIYFFSGKTCYNFFCQKNTLWVWALVAEQVSKIRFLGTRNQLNNGLKASWTRLFFHFLSYLMIFQSFSASLVHSRVRSTLKNHQICHNCGKKWRKALFKLPSMHFSIVPQVPDAQVLGTCFATPLSSIHSTHDHFPIKTIFSIILKSK